MMQTTPKKKKAPPEVPPPNPNPPWSLNVSADVLAGNVLDEEKTKVSPVLALGDALARFEDAMLKRDYHAAAEASFDVSWLARECKLRRGDEGCDLLHVELKIGFQPDPVSTK
jgi:hypothetical protein